MRSIVAPRCRVALALIALATTGCGSHRSSIPALSAARQPSAPASNPSHKPAPAVPSALAASRQNSERHAGASALSAARGVARQFLRSYVAYLYGQLPGGHVRDAAAALRRQLEQGQATTTPAERASRPHVERLELTPGGPPISVMAACMVEVDHRHAFGLTATLVPRASGWLVVAVTG